MATPGPTTAKNITHLAANLLKIARIDKGLSQQQLAVAAGVPKSTIGRIETGAMQPTLPLLCRILAAADLELRPRLEPYEDHDDVLDALDARLSPQQRQDREQAQDRFLAALRDSQPAHA
jgi:transcriptional regulator with XRE-family HTH domain